MHHTAAGLRLRHQTWTPSSAVAAAAAAAVAVAAAAVVAVAAVAMPEDTVCERITSSRR